MASTAFVIPPEVMSKFLDLAVDVGGDLGQSQHLIELIRDEYCINFVVPNLWTYEYEHSRETEPQD